MSIQMMKNLQYLYFFAIFMLSVHNLFAVQLVFPNGDLFIAQLESEDSKEIIVKYKGITYKIIKSDLESIDNSKQGSDNSYTITEIILEDGSKFRGLFVEENDTEIILKTGIGFVNIKKYQIKPPIPIKPSPPDFPEKYKLKVAKTPLTKMGIAASNIANIPAWSQDHLSYSKFGFYIEPAFVSFRDINFGLRLDYLQFFPDSSAQGIAGQIYINYTFWESETKELALYGNLGGGIANLLFNTSTGSGSNRIGSLPIIQFDLGLEYKFHEYVFLRPAIQSICFIEQNQNKCGMGIEISGGVRL
ncbi:LA_3334 family protein [Leptospira sp. GIMC2001]|uniref:LA_3334 family protein n=1 Tax=Leptospira sp. GIMC2001 TaxID=1513297 RepID=UPI002349CD34|nr:hypothetical protein [Leptospira sp. GIMC2001]WCL50982.1 hypothetical protein O4O04_09265 [Leptospira sp. GIMC2001]